VCFQWPVYADAIMGSHFHLLLTTPEPNLSAGVNIPGASFGAFAENHPMPNDALIPRRGARRYKETKPKQPSGH